MAKRKPRGETMGIIDTIRAAEAVEIVNAEAVSTVEANITVDDEFILPEGRAARQSKYPWDTLLAPVVDNGKVVKQYSFFIEGAKVETFNTLCSTRSKKGNGKFVARKWTGPNGVLGVRVFRVA